MWWPALLALGLLLSACQVPHQQIDEFAREQGMTRHVLQGAEFRHVLYEQRPTAQSPTLHVYLEGDGEPWLHGHVPARDPTPRTPLALTLMAVDEQNAIYLGRPCYLGLSSDAECSASVWTDARYSHKVVDSLRAALSRYLERHPAKQVTLIGYSGGGALAVLLAEHLEEVTRVVTVAANLDIERWARMHGYRPLNASLNPAEAAQLQGIHHFHYSGSTDERVPAEIGASFAQRHNGTHRVLASFDHRCCWQEHWPTLLRDAVLITDNNP